MPAPAMPRGLLDRFSLVTSARGSRVGERSSRESGQSVEFLDYRPYEPGDEPRAVDWRAYARTGRLYTRLYRAERSAEIHIVLDTSPSMRLHGKDRFARTVARLLGYLSRQEASGRVHLVDGRRSPPARTHGELLGLWRFVDEAPEVEAPAEGSLADALAALVLGLPAHPGAAAVLVLSDLLDPSPLRPVLAALRARRTDAVFVQLLAQEELEPSPGTWELHDVEGGAALEVGPDEASAYREAVRTFVDRIGAEAAAAGARHLLMPVPAEAGDDRTSDLELERRALGALRRAGVLARR